MMEEEMMLNLETANQFLGLLNPAGVHAFVTFSDKGDDRSLTGQFYGRLDELQADLLARNDSGAGVFVAINEMDDNGYCDKNVVKVRALFIDLDGSDVSPAKNFSLPPHAIVQSSPGRWHVYWLVEGVTLSEFPALQGSLAQKFDSDPSVKNLGRVMRVPGFYHHKKERVRTELDVIDTERAPYPVAQFKAAISEGGAPSEKSPPLGDIGRGERNSFLTRRAGEMRRTGLSEDDIATRLARINATECEEPLPESEVMRIAKSIARYPVSAISPAISASDTGNAQRFVEQHGSNLKYVPERAAWMVWQDSIWQEDAAGQVIEYAKETAKTLFTEAAECTSDVARSALAKHAAQSLNHGRLCAMVKLATTDRQVVTKVTAFDADDFVIGVKNGVVDLRDASFRESRRDDLLTMRSSVSYDATARCPTFLQFIDRVTGGDKELQRYLQRLVGYSLTGSSREQCYVFFYGHGANGKSTFLEVVMRLCGDYASQAQPETLMARRGGGGASSDLARLVGKRVVISNEVREGAQLEENLIKQMVGGDIVTARFLFKEYFQFSPKFKLMIAGNHKPIIKGDDDGIWRRTHLVPFVYTIPEKERDKNLGQKLAKELPGILNWAIEGCLEWQKDGLQQPKVIVDATTDYRSEMDILGEWIEQECIVGTGLRNSSRQLYDSYRKWCEFGVIRPLSNMVFIRKLEGRGFRREHVRSGNIIVGIGLKTRALGVAA